MQRERSEKTTPHNKTLRGGLVPRHRQAVHSAASVLVRWRSLGLFSLSTNCPMLMTGTSSAPVSQRRPSRAHPVIYAIQTREFRSMPSGASTDVNRFTPFSRPLD
jgi:hypothetical protein